MLHLRVASLVSAVSWLNPAKVLLPTLSPIDIVTPASVHLLVTAWTSAQHPICLCAWRVCVCTGLFVRVCIPDLWSKEQSLCTEDERLWRLIEKHSTHQGPNQLRRRVPIAPNLSLTHTRTLAFLPPSNLTDTLNSTLPSPMPRRTKAL